MIRPSFIPPLAIREIRNLTRPRRQLIAENSRERNRVQKVLEDANVKLGDVLSDVFCVSGKLMLAALLDGQMTAEQIADLAKKKAREKIPQITASVADHRLSDHQRFPYSACSSSPRVPGGSGGSAQPRDPAAHGRPGTCLGVPSTPEHSWHQGRICRQHPGRDRRNHGTVSDSSATHFLGWPMSGKPRKRWRKEERSYEPGKCLAQDNADAERMGSLRPQRITAARYHALRSRCGNKRATWHSDTRCLRHVCGRLELSILRTMACVMRRTTVSKPKTEHDSPPDRGVYYI